MKKILSVLTLIAASLMAAGCAMPAGAAGDPAVDPTQTIVMYIVVMAVFFAAMYFIAIRPQKKQEKAQREMLATMQVGDTVLTTSGFYGVVIDITNDTVIVEFGNNKNCRIPMQRAAIVQLEHADNGMPAAETKTEEKTKK